MSTASSSTTNSLTSRGSQPSSPHISPAPHQPTSSHFPLSPHSSESSNFSYSSPTKTDTSSLNNHNSSSYQQQPSTSTSHNIPNHNSNTNNTNTNNTTNNNNDTKNNNDTTNNDTNNTTPTQVELFVRAGKDGESYGGCPICHRFFMLLLIKAEFNKQLQLVVTTVNMSKPPLEFKRLSSRLPVLSHLDQVCSEPDEMVAFLHKTFRYPPMNYDNVTAANACKDVFSRFSFYIKDVSQSPQALLTELHKLDAYLSSSKHLFLNRDLPDHLDCILLPKLQHIRVVCKAFKDFSIPPSFKALWRYLATAYNTTAFRESCPSDQEIIFHWACKSECPLLSKEKKSLLLNNALPYYSFDYPNEVFDEVVGEGEMR